LEKIAVNVGLLVGSNVFLVTSFLYICLIVFFGFGFVQLTTLGLYKEASEKWGLKTGISALLSKRY